MLVLFAPVAISLAIGQTDLLMAAAVVIGFRWPAAWAWTPLRVRRRVRRAGLTVRRDLGGLGTA